MLALDAGSLADLRMPVRSVTGPVTTSAILMCASAPAALRDANGIGNSVIRWSIGLEDAGELIADLDQALAVIS
jgi:cystathionine beta-lyase/cystathionine gamma-synthase